MGRPIAILLIVLAGCSSTPLPSNPPPKTIKLPLRQVKAAVRLPDRPAPAAIGVAWDYAAAAGFFEVWSSSDLVNWRLATNTTEHIAIFDVKPMEFYLTRYRDANGILSQWATTVHH